MLQSVDVGLVVLDAGYRIRLWNGFMENHSGMTPDEVRGESLFELFPEVPEAWFRRKADGVFLLRNRAFTIWEQRPYLFRFRNYRPITGTAQHMYQNITLMPLVSPDGRVGHICLQVYDVTEAAVSRGALERANDRLEVLSRTDSLTGLLNRGAWEEAVAEEFRRYQRTGQVASLVMFDIDHFKHVNDTHGHPAGDAVIRQVAAVLRENTRQTDIGGRYGGEEFAVVLIDTDGEHARVFAERLRTQVEAAVAQHEGERLQVTISLGIAPLGPGIGGHAQWIEHADAGLYASKRGGRNRYTLYRP
ncbi:diguanylate cyclase [Ectothiorhodospiraceae bacterium WFHF3C12]|nr:diguanylate cyclase [Ectothiorhodospiraceae bacterium WFHF3C12]